MKSPVFSRKHKRRGYALLIILLVAAMATIIAIGIFHIARFETMETHARSRSVAGDWAAQAGAERAVALLMANPSLRGPLPTFQIPGSSAMIAVTIQANGQNISVTSVANTNGFIKTRTVGFTAAQLQQRAAAIAP